MNTDLYQSLVVALLGAIAVLLIVAIATLARMRKTLESNASANVSSRPLGSTEPAGASTFPEAREPAAGGGDRAGTVAPEASEPAGRREQAGAVAAGTASSGGEASEAPRGGEAGGPEATQEQVTVAESERVDDEPQEQPYERDGRWWYRRGEELLVYDEQTGQWLQVEGPARSSGYTDTATGEQASYGGAEALTGTIEHAQESPVVRAETSGAFWKCPSCGAINGATSSSCRMCFATRP